MTKLLSYMKSLYKFIIIITHNDQLTCTADTQLLIIHTNGYSKINHLSSKTKDIDFNKQLLGGTSSYQPNQ